MNSLKGKNLLSQDQTLSMVDSNETEVENEFGKPASLQSAPNDLACCQTNNKTKDLFQ